MLQTTVRAIETFDQPRVNTHTMAHFHVCWHPVGGTTTGRTGMELKPTLVPHVNVRGTFATLKRNIVTTVVRPENTKFAEDRTAALKHFCRWFRELNMDCATMTGSIFIGYYLMRS